MFEINDNFLANVGYDLATLSDEQKAEYKQQFANDVTERVILRLSEELTGEQAEEFSEIQDSPERATHWLDEFHSDYREREDFQKIAKSIGDDSDAVTFYAGILWMNDAVPRFGGLFQEELDNYQSELIEKRRAAAYLVDDLDSEQAA